METVLINANSKSDIALLLSLAKKMGMKAKALTKAEAEDWELVQKIEAGMKSGSATRSEIMKALGK
jgi:hypothetical protein